MLFQFKYNKKAFMVSLLRTIGFGASYENAEEERSLTLTIRIWKLNFFYTIGIME